MEKKGAGLSLRQVRFLLGLVLPRRKLTYRLAIELVEEQLARNEAAAISHLRKHKGK